MDHKGKKEKKRSSGSFCFGKSLTLRLPRSKSREKVRMVQSKSVDRLDRKCVTQCDWNSEFVKTVETHKIDQSDHCRSSHCDHCDFHRSRSVQDELVAQEQIASSSKITEPNVQRKFYSVLSNKNSIAKGPSDCKVCDCNRAGPCIQYFEKDFESSCSEKLIPDGLNEERKAPSAPVLALNDDEVYTSRKGSFS